MKKQVIETIIELIILFLIILAIVKIDESRRTYTYSYEGNLYTSDKCVENNENVSICKSGNNYIEVDYYYYEK